MRSRRGQELAAAFSADLVEIEPTFDKIAQRPPATHLAARKALRRLGNSNIRRYHRMMPKTAAFQIGALHCVRRGSLFHHNSPSIIPSNRGFALHQHLSVFWHFGIGNRFGKAQNAR
jgi:hypothetical protein